MKRLCVLLMFITLFFSCKKEREQQEDVSDCALQMKEFFKDELKCTEQHQMEVNLYIGSYKNRQVYFTMTMCPSCNTLPPTHGYNCENKKVDFDDFRDVKNIKVIYNSCTEKFTE